jgi:hypothetical protein
MIVDEHREKGDRNLQFVTDLKSNNINYTDWQIISLFYCAIHYVMWLLHEIVDENGVKYNDENSLPIRTGRNNRILRNHPHRKKLVNDYFTDDEAQVYAFLEHLSMKARYDVLDLITLSQDDFEKCEIFVRNLQPFSDYL